MHDFIIVGAGSAGCVLANRLSAAGAEVLLLEAGGSDDYPMIRTPGLMGAPEGTHLDWGYRTVPQTELNGRRIASPRGRVLGGTSSINYMMYLRGNRGDYDAWAAAGNRGWSYDEVLPYFVRSETNANFQDAYHGSDGPLMVKHTPLVDELPAIFLEAASAVGYSRNDDFNGVMQEGVGRYQATIGPNGRSSTAEAFLRPAMSRPNLEVETHALTTRIVLEGKRATGVEYLTTDGLHVATADETIISAGAINSPQLLMLSGIGAAEELRSVGVAVRHHLPGVGKNLQDHFRLTMRVEIDAPLTGFGGSPEAAAAARDEYLEKGTGPLASNHIEAGGFITCDPVSSYPDAQIFFLKSFGTSWPEGGATDRHGFALGAYINRPKSTGTVRLASAHPFDSPAIDPNFLAASEDRRLATEILRRLRHIANAAPLAALGAREIEPGPAAKSEAELLAFARRFGTTTWHLSGTCRMGIDELAVVDPALRVHGIDGLRIVDASVMPAVPSGNTNAPTIMIAEKAADLFLGQ